MSKGLALLACIAAVLCGACGDDDCETVCAKNAECRTDAPPEDRCIELCEELSEDDAYADALGDQADCYEDAKDCAALDGCTVDLS